MGFIHGIPYEWIAEWLDRGLFAKSIIDEEEAEHILAWVRALDNKYIEYWGNKLSSKSSGKSGTMKKSF
jgi:hypothetical protein